MAAANFHYMLPCFAIIAIAGESQLSVLILLVGDLLFISDTVNIVKQLRYDFTCLKHSNASI